MSRLFPRPFLAVAATALLFPLAGLAALNSPLPFYNPNTAPGVGNFNTNWSGFQGSWQNFQNGYASPTTYPADQAGIVFLGDSITRLADLSPTGLFPGYHTVNRGIDGDTSRGMVYRLQDNVLDMNPLGMVLLCGTNDFLQPGGDPMNTAANVKTMVEAFHAANPTKWVALLKVMPNMGYADTLIQSYNTAVDNAVAGDMSYIIRVDTFTAFQNPGKTPNANGSTYSTTLTYDGTHPSAAGFQVYKNLMTPVLQQMTTTSPVPEPSTYGLMGAGALAAAAFVRRRRKNAGKFAR